MVYLMDNDNRLCERCVMMATVISSIGLKGIEGYRVQVEVQLLPGVEGVSIVGIRMLR